MSLANDTMTEGVSVSPQSTDLDNELKRRAEQVKGSFFRQEISWEFDSNFEYPPTLRSR
jgi:hypothetical protein